MLVATGCGMVDNVLNMAGRTAWTLANVVTALVVDVALNLLLVPRFGILGAAVAWAAAILANNLIPLGQVAFSLRLHPFGRGTLIAAALAIGCYGVLPGVAVLVLGRDLPVLLGVVALATALYGTGLWAARDPLRLTGLRAELRAVRQGRAPAVVGHRAAP
jgi:O-antigen/teichoic acid export membrane protein